MRNPKPATNDRKQQRDPAVVANDLRARILGGGRPLLDSLSADEMAAANAMLLNGQAEITCHSCRLFLTAKVADEPIPMDGLRTVFRRLARLRRDLRRIRTAGPTA